MKQEYASNIFHRIPQIYPIEEAFATLKRWIKLNYVMMDTMTHLKTFLKLLCMRKLEIVAITFVHVDNLHITQLKWSHELL